MEFDLTAFTLAPSIEVFNKCRKNDLLLIADFFEIDVSKKAAKRVIRKELLCELVKTGIMPADSEEVLEHIATAEEAVFADLAPSINPASPRFDPVLAIKLKELELELKKQEYALQVVHLRTVEIEAERDVQLHSMECNQQRLLAKSLCQKPVTYRRKTCHIQKNHIQVKVSLFEVLDKAVWNYLYILYG